MLIRENLFVIYFIAGARCTCPCLGRNMGLPERAGHGPAASKENCALKHVK
jgi:hypothetical protein